MEPRGHRCLDFQDELRRLRQRLSALRQPAVYSPGPNPELDPERELGRC
jgi:hypothetical protein